MMAHPYYHAKSSARKFGGCLQDYLAIHEWFDHTKAHLADARHRLVLHNSWGIFLAEQVLGKTLTRADGKEIPTRPIFEQHVTEDLGFIPTLEQCFGLAEITVEPWMYRKASPLSMRKDISVTTTPLTRDQVCILAREYTALANWTTVRDFCYQLYGTEAVKAELEVEGEYNDEGGTTYSVTSLVAYDIEGQELTYPLTLPFWQQFEDLQREVKKQREAFTPEVRAELESIHAKMREVPSTNRALRRSLAEQEQELLTSLGHPKDEDELQEMARAEMKDWYPYGEEKKAAKAAGWIQWDELPAGKDGETTFDFTSPPKLSYPEVYGITS